MICAPATGKLALRPILAARSTFTNWRCCSKACLKYAMNSFQAFSVCIHVIHSYTSWREYGTEMPYYRWTDKLIPVSETNTLNYLEFHLEAVCKSQRQNGLQLPRSIKQHAWNQLAVESGYVHECVRKKEAVQTTMDVPHPLFDGDGLFPPKLQGHPNWVYATGRVATPWASNLEPEGLKPPNHGTRPEPGRASTSMPKATPAHGPKRARTDENRSSASSSSAPPPPPHQPEDEPARDMWMEAPIPYGAKEYSFRFLKPDGTKCRTVLLTTERNMNEYPHSIDETPKFVNSPTFGTTSIELCQEIGYLSCKATVCNAKQCQRAYAQGVCEAGHEGMVADVFQVVPCLRTQVLHAFA